MTSISNGNTCHCGLLTRNGPFVVDLVKMQKNKKPLKTARPDCKAATKFENVD